MLVFLLVFQKCPPILHNKYTILCHVFGIGASQNPLRFTKTLADFDFQGLPVQAKNRALASRVFSANGNEKNDR
ncbi:MAG: hypothetical protein FWG17_05345 [Desulfovibrionaceae bacterium]|nr:hypothetical protein [Desulfovibrionaceae bacterium]